ncbi:MAG: hypothetical protein J6X66_09125 [Lachnospiraceae bacterium]|nr:hypothetical protein [Lachnospiraceae bacterium]
MEKNVKMVVCVSCGSRFEASLVRCPYCGTAYAPAEDEEYMGQLEDIRKDLEGHKEDGNKSLKSGMTATVRFVIIAVVVILLIVLGSLWASHDRERNRSDRRKEEFLIDQGIIPEQGDE